MLRASEKWWRAGALTDLQTSHTPVARPTSVPVRLGLQRQAWSNLRRHGSRGALRVGALLAGDLVSFLLMRAFVQAVRDDAVLGSGIANLVKVVLARGILNGWQFGVALVIGLIITGCYGPGDQPRGLRRLFAACALATAMPMWSALWTRGVDLAVLQYAVTTLLVWMGVSGERLATGVLMTRLAPPRREGARTLFVGTPAACREGMTGGAGAGFVDVATPPAADALGHVEDLPALLNDSHADTGVVCSQLSDERMRHLVETTLAAGCRLLIVPQTDAVGSTMAIVWQGGRPLIAVTTPALKGRQLFVKRAVDLLGALLGLTIAAPLMLIV